MLHKVSIKHRIPYITIRRGILSVEGNGFSFEQGMEKTLIPVSKFLIIFIEPGVSITHRAVELAAKLGTLLIFTSEGGTRLYSMGTLWNKNNSNMIMQSKAAFSVRDKKKVLNEMFKIRFGEYPPRRNLSEDELRGHEGARVKAIYKFYANKYNVVWNGRSYVREDGLLIHNDVVNQAISHANFALYSVTEAVIHALGYSPAIGFMHSGTNIAFVLDIADLIKFETTVPLAFKLANTSDFSRINKDVRLKCRDLFQEEKIIEKIIDLIEKIFEPIKDKY